MLSSVIYPDTTRPPDHSFYCRPKSLSLRLRGLPEVVVGTSAEGAMGGCEFSLADLRGELLPLEVSLLGLLDGWRIAPWERWLNELPRMA